MKTLAYGSRGSEVKELQRFLGISADGIFGKNTRSAVISYQRSSGLVADGIVGARTWASILSVKSEPIKDQDIRDIIEANKHKLTSKTNNKNNKIVSFDPAKHLIVVAIRGFKPEMGVPNQNDRRIYDDGHFIVTPDDVRFYAGNTDPNGYRKGYGTGSKKGMAMLDTGVWFYGKGPHNGRSSFRQCAPVTVTRDGNPPYKDTGWFGINWHSATDTSTSSLGCQTNKPADFTALRNYIYKELDNLDNPKLCHDWSSNFNATVGAFPYLLIDEQERRKGNLKL